MPSPVAHAFAGAAVYAGLTPGRALSRDWRPWALAVLAGVAADLDFLPGLLVGDPSRYHHWATHSLAAAGLFALLAARLASPVLGAPGRRAVILGLAYATHLALDLVTVDRTVPRGIPLLWPFSEAVFLSPLLVFTDIHHGASWSAFVNWHNVGAVLRETIVVGGPVTLYCALRLRQPEVRPAVAADASPTG